MTSPIDLNAADAETIDGIDDLRGHGFEIVRYRDERGGFTSVDQLEEVPGLTGKLTDAAKAQLKVA